MAHILCLDTVECCFGSSVLSASLLYVSDDFMVLLCRLSLNNYFYISDVATELLVGWLGFNGTFSTNRPYRARLNY